MIYCVFNGNNCCLVQSYFLPWITRLSFLSVCNNITGLQTEKYSAQRKYSRAKKNTEDKSGQESGRYHSLLHRQGESKTEKVVSFSAMLALFFTQFVWRRRRELRSEDETNHRQAATQELRVSGRSQLWAETRQDNAAHNTALTACFCSAFAPLPCSACCLPSVKPL